jgi:hypothetical protein
MKNEVFVMLSPEAVVTTEVSKERSASIIRVTRNRELATKSAVTSNRSKLRILHNPFQNPNKGKFCLHYILNVKQ